MLLNKEQCLFPLNTITADKRDHWSNYLGSPWVLFQRFVFSFPGEHITGSPALRGCSEAKSLVRLWWLQPSLLARTCTLTPCTATSYEQVTQWLILCFAVSVSYNLFIILPLCLVFYVLVVFIRGPKGSGAVPGGPHQRWPQLHRSLCEGHPAWPAYPDLPGVLPDAAAQPSAASVQHARGPSAGRAAHRGGTYSPIS